MDFPNKEVREGFYASLLNEFAGCDLRTLARGAERVRRSLVGFAFQEFVDQINEFLRNSPAIADKEEEAVFRHLSVLIVLEFCLPKTIVVNDEFAVVAMNEEEAEIVMTLSNAVYVFQLKRDEERMSVETREAMKYGIRFYHKNKRTVLLKINFSTRFRSIDNWIGVLLKGESVVRRFSADESVEKDQRDDQRSTVMLSRRSTTTNISNTADAYNGKGKSTSASESPSPKSRISFFRKLLRRFG
jgi:hypothetical protein